MILKKLQIPINKLTGYIKAKCNIVKSIVNSKKSKENKSSKDSNNKDNKKEFMLFSIRNKIFICFIVPIVFMIVVGVSAYNKASDGMTEKFKETSVQTIKMTKEYLDMTNSFIKSEGMKYGSSDAVNNYSRGKYVSSNKAKHVELAKSIQTEITAAQMTNSFIQNIHIITPQGIDMLSTDTAGLDGIYEEYMAEMQGDSGNYVSWVGVHNALDTHLNQSDEEYILSYQLQHYSGSAMVVVDVKVEPIRSILNEIDLGEGSIVGMVTADGKEIICEKKGEDDPGKLQNGEKVFAGREFYQTVYEQEEMIEDAFVVECFSEEYMFVYSKSEDSGICVCALVPMHTVVGQAKDIRSVTITMVVIACIIAGIVGVLIASGIQRNMKRISRKLVDVANGDLTGTVTVKGKDELQSLADSATHMIHNTSKLVGKVNNATAQLDESAKKVSTVSDIISDYSANIIKAINEINTGMEKQSENAEICMERMDILSNDMQEVSDVTGKVGNFVEEAEKMIEEGVQIVQILKERAKQTAVITSEVGSSVELLQQESETINSFVQTIASISAQTNLLSLNASIEAARAGAAGRGFAVVADEISKLADESAMAAANIRKKVELIGEHTLKSVNNAVEAEKMVDLQSEAVSKVINVFEDISERMKLLFEGLKEIMESAQKADSEKANTLVAVHNISEIIGVTAENSEIVYDVAADLIHNVEKLTQTADVLNDNMQTLKSEIELFKTE